MNSYARIAIMGGTFDPIHRGHLEPLLEVRASFGWEQVVLMPASTQPFKSDGGSASPFHRYAMAVLATEGLGGVLVSSLELERGSTSYTVDTLEAMKARHPRASLEWIIGDDNLAALEQWQNVDRILELANLIVLRRRGQGEQRAARFLERIVPMGERKGAGSLVMAENRIIPVSATEIRARLNRGDEIDDLVTPAVARYVKRYSLYV